ncbi:MAG: hypothetical protein ACRC8A_04210 [Microcoleaceae cyanobacterium]
MFDSGKHKKPTQIEILSYYTYKFMRVRVDRAWGIAPHKPILLLSVIELIRREIITENKIFLTSELITTFLKYWLYFGSENHNPDISRPFFFMRSGKFWHLWPNPGYSKLLASKVKLKTFAEVDRAVKYAYLDEDLFDLLQIPKTRASLILALTIQWFKGQHELIEVVSQIDLPSELQHRSDYRCLVTLGKILSETHEQKSRLLHWEIYET